MNILFPLEDNGDYFNMNKLNNIKITNNDVLEEANTNSTSDVELYHSKINTLNSSDCDNCDDCDDCDNYDNCDNCDDSDSSENNDEQSDNNSTSTSTSISSTSTSTIKSASDESSNCSSCIKQQNQIKNLFTNSDSTDTNNMIDKIKKIIDPELPIDCLTERTKTTEVTETISIFNSSDIKSTSSNINLQNNNKEMTTDFMVNYLKTNDDLTYCSEVTSSTNISKNKKSKKINICININEIENNLTIEIGRKIKIKM
jgi:hypothetical protein